MNVISAVKYMVNESIIRISSQLQMKEAIMTENESRFLLACSSPVFNPTIIEKLGQ